MATPVPFISIIIPVRNAARTMATTFKYLAEVDWPRDRWEIVLADGGSTDKTVEIIKDWQKKYPYIKVVEIPNCKSPGFARNKALEVVKGDIILFTDGDCAPAKDWVYKMVEPFTKDPSIGGVGGEVLTLITDPDNITESYCEQTKFLSVTGRCGVRSEGYFPGLTNLAPTEVASFRAPFFATANAAYSAKALESVGNRFWDEPTGEDVEMSYKILKAGWKLYFKQNAVVKHMHRTSLAALCKVWIGYGLGHPVLVKYNANNYFELCCQFLPGQPSINIPSKLKGLIIFGNFQMMHIFGLLSLIFVAWNLISGSALSFWLLISGLALTALFIYSYFVPCSKLKPRSRFFTWAKIRYLTNWAFIRGALRAFKRTGILFIEPSW